MKFTAEQIKEIRQRTGLSQKLFALAIGITPRAVRNWEQGISEPGSTATRILEIVERDDTILQNYITK